MFESTIIFIGLIIYLVLSYFLIRYVARRIFHLKNFLQILIRSFLYAFFFGIGIFGSGGEPGFALPVPNLIAIFFSIFFGIKPVIEIALLIFACWWILIFFLMALEGTIQKMKSNQSSDNYSKFTQIPNGTK